MAEADRAHVRVRLGAEPVAAAAEHLRAVESSTWHSSPMTVSSSAMTGAAYRTSRPRGRPRTGTYHRWHGPRRPATRSSAPDRRRSGRARGRLRHLGHHLPGDPGRRTRRSRRSSAAASGSWSPERCSTRRDPPRRPDRRPPDRVAVARRGDRRPLLLLGGNGGVVWAEHDDPLGDRGAARRDSSRCGWRCSTALVFHRHHAARGDRRARARVRGRRAAGRRLRDRRARRPARDARRGRRVALLGDAARCIAQGRAPAAARSSAAAMEMLVGGVALSWSRSSPASSADVDPSRFSRASLLALAYLIVFGSWVGFTSYLWLLRNARTSLVVDVRLREPGGRRVPRLAGPGRVDPARTLVAGGVILVAVALIVSAGGARARGRARLRRPRGAGGGASRPEVAARGRARRGGARARRGRAR